MSAPPEDRSRNHVITISGWGLVTPLGRCATETFSHLLAGRTIADRTGALATDTDPVDLAVRTGTAGIRSNPTEDPAVELAVAAGREALKMAGLDAGDVDCFIGTSKGAVAALQAATQHQPRRRSANGDPASAPWPLTQDTELATALGSHGYLALRLQQRLGTAAAKPVVAACASSLTALHTARTEIQRSAPRAKLVITAEASLLPLFIHSYRRLGVLAPLSPQRYRGRPLDRHRNGFMLSEMAAAVVLTPTSQPQSGQIELVDTAIAAESYDLIRTPARSRALSRLAEQLMGNRRIDLIHPHATGTVDHDETELDALGAPLAGPSDVYASKGAIGHGLGASGLASLVIACHCARSGQRPPMNWLTDPVLPAHTGLRIHRHAAAGPFNTQAIFAAGFGGHVAGALITRR